MRTSTEIKKIKKKKEPSVRLFHLIIGKKDKLKTKTSSKSVITVNSVFSQFSIIFCSSSNGGTAIVVSSGG